MQHMRTPIVAVSHMPNILDLIAVIFAQVDASLALAMLDARAFRPSDLSVSNCRTFQLDRKREWARDVYDLQGDLVDLHMAENERVYTGACLHNAFQHGRVFSRDLQ